MLMSGRETSIRVEVEVVQKVRTTIPFNLVLLGKYLRRVHVQT
jgi:hypothetical protein